MPANCSAKSSADDYLRTISAEYDVIGSAPRARADNRKFLSLAQARANGLELDWSSYTPPVPKRLGQLRLDNFPLAELVPYIDWTPFS